MHIESRWYVFSFVSRCTRAEVAHNIKIMHSILQPFAERCTIFGSRDYGIMSLVHPTAVDVNVSRSIYCIYSSCVL